MNKPNENTSTEARISARLLALTEEALTHDPPDLPAYIRRHLTEHARAARTLDRRILNPRLLPHLDAARLRTLTGWDPVDATPGLWDAFRRATHQWDFDRPASNATQLELQAASLGIPLTEPTTPTGWHIHWTTPGLLGAEILGTHTSPVRAVTTAVLDGRPVAVTGGGDGTVRIWDLASGQPVGEPLTGHNGSARAVATVVLNGRMVVVTGGGVVDGTVRVWDLASG
ncbi:WD domain-containing protein, G-beta repeat-containing protein, partial [Streptomyces sp. DvalAA-14]|uniref:WD40 repeat domain-containing protein n=1 Tax=Streptomyces sp. DvalAA-14 TaxID=1839759 RepID=UPI00081B2924